ncbi:MAG: dethiobiotin synthase [Polyangiales bacterium]
MSSRDDKSGPGTFGVFVTATGTAAGKTLVSTALVRALVARKLRVAGLKPIETGCSPFPADAMLLAHASGDAELAHSPAWYRAGPPLAPYAIELTTSQPPPDFEAITSQVTSIAQTHDCVVVEGAGGLLVPLDRQRSMADLAHALALPLLLVADDRLGVLSYVLAACESAERRSLKVAAVVLNRLRVDPLDPSGSTNHRILRERLQVPILQFPQVPIDVESLIQGAEQAGLPDLVLSLRR